MMSWGRDTFVAYRKTRGRYVNIHGGSNGLARLNYQSESKPRSAIFNTVSRVEQMPNCPQASTTHEA